MKIKVRVVIEMMFVQFLVAASLLFAGVSAVTFNLQAWPEGNTDNTRCFYLYIGKDVMFTGEYKVSDGYNQKLNVEVGRMLQYILLHANCKK